MAFNFEYYVYKLYVRRVCINIYFFELENILLNLDST